MSTRPSWELAEFAVGLGYADLPSAVIQSQKDHLLDGLGNGLHGSTTPLGRMIVGVVNALPTHGNSTIWGSDSRVNCGQAAFANATFANVSEMEDGHHRTKFKPNACLTPAGIAVAERQGASGRDLLTGLVAALEVSIRVSESTHVGKEGYRRGWLATSSIGPIGAAVVAGRLIGLNVEQMVHALALAANQPSGIWSTGLTMGKRVAIGRAAENGIVAAFMAAQGITGGDRALDAEWGRLGLMISPVDEPALLTAELGSAWRTLTVGLKCYPTKGSAHSSVDALLNILRREADLRPSEIDRIRVRATTGVATNPALLSFPPEDYFAAQSSVPYILAVTAIDRACGLDQFSDERVHDPDVLALGRRVSIERCDEADQMPPQAKTAIVDVYLHDGRVLSERVDYCTGEPENPLSPAGLAAKFRTAARFALDEPTMAAVVQLVMSLDELPNLAPLSRLLAVPALAGVAERR